MPRRPRHLDADLVRRMNPEGEDLLDEPPLPMPCMKALLAEPSCFDQPPPRELDARAALKAIGEFVLKYPRGRYGAGPEPVDVGQTLALSKALLQAMALLLKRTPEQLRRTLEAVVYGDLSEPALAEARRTLNILDRKTLPELLASAERLDELNEPYDWGDVDPETMGSPVVHGPDGSIGVGGPGPSSPKRRRRKP